MSQENGWPEVLDGVLNPIDNPYAAALKLTEAMLASGQIELSQEPDRAALTAADLLKATIRECLKLEEHFNRALDQH